MNDRQMADWHNATCPDGHPYIDIGPHVAICGEDRHADGVITHGARSAIAELVAALRAERAARQAAEKGADRLRQAWRDFTSALDEEVVGAKKEIDDYLDILDTCEGPYRVFEALAINIRSWAQDDEREYLEQERGGLQEDVNREIQARAAAEARAATLEAILRVFSAYQEGCECADCKRIRAALEPAP